MGLIFDLGSFSRRRKRRGISHLERAYDRTGLGLGHPLARRGEPCLAHRHHGSGPFDHDGADRRTNGDNSLRCSDGTRFSSLLDHVFLWILQILLAMHTVMGAVWKLSNSEQTVAALNVLPHSVWLGLSFFELLCALLLVVPLFRL